MIYGELGLHPVAGPASMILQNDSDGSAQAVKRNELNSFMVYNECFGTAPGTNLP